MVYHVRCFYIPIYVSATYLPMYAGYLPPFGVSEVNKNVRNRPKVSMVIRVCVGSGTLWPWPTVGRVGPEVTDPTHTARVASLASSTEWSPRIKPVYINRNVEVPFLPPCFRRFAWKCSVRHFAISARSLTPRVFRPCVRNIFISL